MLKLHKCAYIAGGEGDRWIVSYPVVCLFVLQFVLNWYSFFLKQNYKGL